MTAAESKRKWARYQGKETSAYQGLIWFAALLIISSASLQAEEPAPTNIITIERSTNESLRDRDATVAECLDYATNHYKSFTVVSVEKEVRANPLNDNPSDIPGWRDIVWKVRLTNLVKRTHLSGFDYWPSITEASAVNLYDYECRISELQQKRADRLDVVYGVVFIAVVLVVFALYPREIITIILLAIGIHYANKAVRKIIGKN